MPTPTYVPLATITLTATDSEIVFSSIPATFRDLILVVNGTSNAATSNLFVQLNADAGTNYTNVFMGANGGTFSGTSSSQGFDGGAFTTTRSFNIFQLMDYSATDKHKTMLTRNNSGTNFVIAFAGRYASTAAITSWRMFSTAAGSVFNTGTTFSLYGIA